MAQVQRVGQSRSREDGRADPGIEQKVEWAGSIQLGFYHQQIALDLNGYVRLVAAGAVESKRLGRDCLGVRGPAHLPANAQENQQKHKTRNKHIGGARPDQ